MVINRGEGAEPATLDPHKITGTWEYNIVGDMFIGLIQHAKDGKSIPAIAKSWTISKNGKIYTFNLRHDARWSDGEPITSEDFIYSISRILNPKFSSDYTNLLYPIKNAQLIHEGKKSMKTLGVKALDKYTLQITLEVSTPYFLSLLKHFIYYPVPRHVIEKYGKDWTNPKYYVSNGPFILESWRPKTYIKAIKNPKFFDAKDVKPDEVYYHLDEDETLDLRNFISGELDISPDFPTEQYKWLLKEIPNETIVSPHIGIYHYVINFRDKTFQNRRVREALNLAVDREVLIENVLQTGEIPAYSFVPKMDGYEFAQLNFKSMSMKKRIQKAKNLLAKSGYSLKNPLEVTISYNTGDNHRKIAIAIASMWANIGVKTKFVNSEVNTHYANIAKGEFQIARAGYIANYTDPYNFLGLYEAPQTFKYGSWNNKKYNKLVANAQKVTDLKQRAKIMKKAEKLMLDDFATIPIYYYVSRNLVNKNLRGWVPNPTNIHRTRWMWKDKK